MAESGQQKSVWLNNVEIPIIGKLTKRRITPFPAEFRTGPKQAQDYTPTEKQTWGPLKGGMGLEKWEPGADDRYWYSVNVDCSRNVTTLGPLVTTLGSFGAIPLKIIKYEAKVFAIGHNAISYWTGSAWQSVKADFANPTDAITFYDTSASYSQTFNPDAHTESTSVDGHAFVSISEDTWATIRGHAGSGSFDAADGIDVGFVAGTTNDKFTIMQRGIILFDLSNVPSGVTLASATLSVYGVVKLDGFSATPELNVYLSAPASDTAVVAGDYDSLGTTAYCDTQITYTNFDADGRNEFVFNSTGRSAVTTALAGDGILKLGLRESKHDAANSAPSWVSAASSYFEIFTADKGVVLGVDYRPILTLEFERDASTFLCIASAASGSIKTETTPASSMTFTTCAQKGAVALDSEYFAQFDNRLAAISGSNAGFYYSDANDITSDWTEKPYFPNLPQTFTDLFVGKNASDEPTLYMLTLVGMYYLDVFTTFVFGPTEVTWEEDANSGKAGLYWKGDHYIAVGKGILKVSGGVVTQVGPDMDDGLPSILQGNVTDIRGIGYWLVIAVDGGSSKRSCILKRYITGNHWHVVYVTPNMNDRIRCLFWADGTLYFGLDTDVKSLPFPAETDNVKLLSTHTYSASGDLYTSWFSSPFESMTKVAHKVRVVTQDCDASETITVYERTDEAEAFVDPLGVINASPTDTALPFPASGDAIGSVFERIQFKLAFARGATTTHSPKLETFIFEYRVIPPVLWDWTIRVDATKHGEHDGQYYIDALDTAIESSKLLAFYPGGSKDGTKYLVEVKQMPHAVGGTEEGEEGHYQLTVGEVSD